MIEIPEAKAKIAIRVLVELMTVSSCTADDYRVLRDAGRIIAGQIVAQQIFAE